MTSGRVEYYVPANIKEDDKEEYLTKLTEVEEAS